MSLAGLAIKRPVFITCIVVLMLAVGIVSMRRLGVDLFPDVTFPVVLVTTPYPGAGPTEIETLVTKPIEEELSTLSGIKRLSSISQEGVSTVIAEFTLETDVKFAEQQIRDRASGVRRKLPDDVKDSVIRRIDPADQPVVILSLDADLPQAQLYDVANDVIKPKIEQVDRVGLVDIIGGRKREIRVVLDRDKLKNREISVTSVANRLAATGQDIPAGKLDVGNKEMVFRSLGQFTSLGDINEQVVSFVGSDVPVKVSDVGSVVDTVTDETARVYTNGKQSVFLLVFRQSGANTIAVVDGVKARVEKLNAELANVKGKPKLTEVRDGSKFIHANVDDVRESIMIGIVLAVIVVFFFLGSARSTIITGLALPNSLIGAFILMSMAGFSINVMSLLALSLAVGLLVDDAIVVRENIFRHLEMGKPAKQAALEGTHEVTLAVIATTLAILAVFGPVGFLKGVVGQFFKQFGLTLCFAMAISLFDALTMAPMLSAYFAGKAHTKSTNRIYNYTIGFLLSGFDRFQNALENGYERVLEFTVRRPVIVLFLSFVVFIVSMASIKGVPKTFLPTPDNGEFTVTLELAPGTTLEKMTEVASEVDGVIRENKEVEVSALTVGSREGDANKADYYIRLVNSKQRTLNTTQVKDRIREQLKKYAAANPQVKDYDAVGAGQRPFNVNIVGSDQKQLEEYSLKALEIMKKHKGLREPDWNYRSGKPEFQMIVDNRRADALGISSALLGTELRNQVEGAIPAKFREEGREYDIRVRLKDSQRNLQENFGTTYVPNINNNLVRLINVAKPVDTTGPAKITRQDRGRYIQISADLMPGAGLGDIINELDQQFQTELKLPAGMRYAFVGQAENFKELAEGMITAMGLGILFIYLVLASLYESWITPFTIMLALPLALCGSFLALFITQQTLNIFSMIGTIMLLGVASKNSILLVDYANKLIQGGMDRSQAIIRAGRVRLRPILMTTMALIAGTLPVALGLNEASRQRTSMGIAIIGGLISSTLLTLIVVPAAFTYIDRFRAWGLIKMKRIFMAQQGSEHEPDVAGGVPVELKSEHGRFTHSPKED